jgi:hypothetical protein
MRNHENPGFLPRLLFCWIIMISGLCGGYARGGGSGPSSPLTTIVPAPSQQPQEPTDATPLNGEVYYVVNQLSGLQADLDNNSTTAGDHIVQQPRSFTNLSQRWAFTRLSGGFWRISNIRNGLCFDSAAIFPVPIRLADDAGGAAVRLEACRQPPRRGREMEETGRPCVRVLCGAESLRGCRLAAVGSHRDKQWLLHDLE